MITCITRTFLAPSLLAAAVAGGAGARSADPTDRRPDPAAVYAPRPDHLWNRVHAALLVRTGPDGKEYGHDRLEPLLWAESRYLLDGKPAERAIAVLNEFDRDKGELLFDDPARRAVLQRDLWLVASWLAGAPGSNRGLERALDTAIRRLALSPRQVARLPDNYAAAVASKKYAARFDPEKPDRAYLPPDLFDETGPWVCVGPAEGPTAPFHLDDRGANRFVNSAFLVFLKLPGGRGKTLDFLARLAALGQLVVPNPDEKTKRLAPVVPHPDFPRWPVGTEVALVRRALLITSDRRVAASPLAESVQVRVVTADVPTLTPDVLQKVASRRPPAEWHAAFEFQLRRADLFAGTAGGLRDVSADRDFHTGFGTHARDPFDEPPGPALRDRAFPGRVQPFESNRASCASCHTSPGVYSFGSIREFAFGGTFRAADDEDRGNHRPGPTTVAAVEKRAVRWRESRPDWNAFVRRSGE